MRLWIPRLRAIARIDSPNSWSLRMLEQLHPAHSFLLPFEPMHTVRKGEGLGRRVGPFQMIVFRRGVGPDQASVLTLQNSGLLRKGEVMSSFATKST